MTVSTISHERNVADDEDLAGGDNVGAADSSGANFYVEQIKAIQWLRYIAVGAAAVVLIALLVGMGVTVCSFTAQIDKATPQINLKDLIEASGKPAEKQTAEAAAAVAPGAVKATTAASPGDGAADAAAAELHTSVKVDISSVATSAVAVIWGFVLASSVLAIALLRSAFSLSAERGGSNKASEEGKASDSSLPLPALEALKATAEAFATAIKGITGGK